MKVNKSFLYFFLLFPFFKSDIVTELNSLQWLDYLYDIWKLVAMIIMTYFAIKDKKIDVKLIFIFALTAIVAFSTIINSGMSNLISYVNVQLSVIYISILVYLARANNDMKNFLRAAYTLLAVYCIGNLISVIIYAPVGAMYIPDNTGIITKNRYLLGSKNYQILFVFPFIGLSSIYDIYCFQNIRKRTIVLQILSIIPLFLTEAVTAIIGIVIYYLLYFMVNKVSGVKKHLNEVSIIMVNMIAFIFLIVLDGQRYFSNFFMILFHKNLQSQRAFIWQKYLYVISEKVMLGYGYVSYAERRMSVGVVHAHNQYLDIIYQSGLIGMGIFILLIGYSLKKVQGNKIKYIIICSILVWLIMFQSEYYYTNPGFYIFLFLCFDWNNLEKMSEQNAVNY